MSPPSQYRAILLIIRLAGRRFWNRVNGQFATAFGKRKKKTDGRRHGTPGKSRGGSILLAIFLLMMLPQSISFSARFVSNLIAQVVRSEQQEPLDEALKPLEKTDNPLRERLDAADKDREHGTQKVRRAERFWPSAGGWPTGEPRRRLLIALALFFTLLFPAVLFATLGSANRDLSQVEWNLEWLFTFPVSGESLFLAKILEYSFVNAIGWFFFGSPLFAIFWMAGLGWSSIPLAVGGMYFLNILVAALRIIVETALRKHLSLSRIKNLQALFTVIGILLLYTVFYLAIAVDLPNWFVTAARGARGMLLWLPWSLPLWMAREGGFLLAGAGLLVSLAVLAAGAGCIIAGRQVRDGLVKSSSPFQGTRRKKRAKPATDTGGLFTGILGKEVRLLLRDRAHCVQTLVLPLLIIGFQLLVNKSWLEAAARDPRHGAMTAFGFGAYVLLFGGASVLTTESKSLWMLYSFPRRIEDVLRSKVLLWAAVSSVYVLGTVGILVLLGPKDLAALPLLFGHTVMAVAGVVIYAFIAAGLGALGANPLADERNRRLRPEYLYLYMLLAALFGYGIYAPQIWPKVTLLTLCALLAYAIWQKVRDRIPYLLDPTESPPPAISLSDGLIATLIYFVLQGVILLTFGFDRANKGPLLAGERITLASGIAGITVILLFLFSFWWRKVPGALLFLGFRRDDASRARWSTAFRIGLLCGALAAVVGISYLKLVEAVPVLREYKESLQTMAGGSVANRWWLVGFAVIVAPIVEEFIFRGLVFRGLRRTLPAAASIVASAAIFAIVHAPISVAPVFVMGALAALSFERSRLLVAPIVAHATYNAAIMAATL